MWMGYDGVGKMAEALLRADRVRDLGLGVEIDPPVPLVERGDRFAELGQTSAYRVPVVAWVPGRLCEFLDGDRR
jgi:hypothetical protein